MREDEEIANKIRRIKDKKVILVVNKIDNKEKMDEISQFYNLGLGEPIGVSSIHGIGINDLLDSIVKDISQAVEILDKTPKIGIIGKPNVGKSTLLNKITKDDRMIVSEVAGTTRDAVDTRIKYKEQEYIFTDTAGIKKNKKTLNDIEFYAEIRANLTIETATIVLLLIDLSQGISKIDERLIGVLKDKKKPTIIVVNKADLLDPEDRKEELRNLEAHFDYATYMPIIFISAETGRNIPKLFEMFDKLEEERTREINKHQLNEFLIDLIFVKKPPRHNGIEVKLKYITFVKDVVPHFIIFSNKPEFLHFSYQRFIEKQIRIVFNLQNIPVKISLRSSYGK
ncbi:MAG: ribosome biogenesis GTPase Der [Tenericutes bacterium]|nr:MAG: ribosome biogenesis GTPase Der [Mycoplasmatota bacterium]